MSAPLPLLDQFVLGQLRRRMHDAGYAELPDEAVAAARAMLSGEELTPDEQSMLEDGVQDETLDPSVLVLASRIEQAIRAGFEAAGLPAVEVPDVVVLRDSSTGHMMAAIARIRARLTARMKGEGGSLLLVATNQVYQKVKRLLPAGGGGGLPTVDYHDDVPDESGTAGAIEIVSADVSNAALERKATASLEALREGSVSDDSMKAAWLAGAGSSDAQGDSLPEDPQPAKGNVPPPQGQEPEPEERNDEPGQDDDPMIGRLFHLKYRIVKRLGTGGFGSVYEAADERGAGNRVAIKVLSGKAAESVAQQQSFKDEARRVTRLSHPNVVDWKVFDETEDGTPYFVMELVEGEEFEETLRRERKIAPQRAARLLLQVLDALRAAHHLSKRESILHLDLKPANLFRIPPRQGRDEQLKVIDFGIGQYIGAERVEGDQVVREEGLAPADPGELSSLTFSRENSSPAPSGVKRSRGCTPEYASPEQCDHVLDKPDIQALDGRSDLYSVGVIAFEMLTGQLPFKAKSRLDVMRMHQEDAAPRVGSMGVRVPRRLATFIDRCLQKEPDRRWRDTNEAYQYLHELVHPPAWKAVAKVTVPLLLVGAALGGWAWATREVIVPTVGLMAPDGVDPSTSPLFLGPERRGVDLELIAAAGVLPERTDGLWHVRRVSDGSASSAWTAGWSAPGFVALRASDAAPDGRLGERVELVLDEDTLRSQPMELVWIGPGGWDVAEVRVGERPVDELRDLGVDPYGTSLDIALRGEARGDIDEVTVRAGAKAPLTLSLGTSPEGRSSYRLDLAEAGLAPGPSELFLRVRDRAGAEWARTVELNVVPGEPELERVAIVDAAGERGEDGEWPRANKLLGAFVISPRTQATLRASSSRPADISWKVFVEGLDQPQMQGQATGMRRLEADLAGLGQLRGGDPYRGHIEILAREDAYVLHAPGSNRGEVAERIAFSFEDMLPTFAADWQAVDKVLGLRADGVTFTNAAAAAVVVTRTQPVPMRIELAWWPADRPDEVQSADSLALGNLQTQQATLPLTLTEDGAWTLRLTSYRYDSAAKTVGERPDVAVLYQVVLDRSPPTIHLAGLDGLTVTAADAAPDEVSVLFKSLSGAAEPAVDLHWDFARLGGGTPRRASGRLEAQDPTAARAVLALNGFLRDPTLPDGQYRLAVSGTDSAGNDVDATVVDFTVALRGPEITLAEPSGLGKWHADPVSGRWTVRALASDPNGIDEIACEFITADVREPVSLAVQVGSSKNERALTGSLLVPYTLSGAKVQLAFRATDSYGSQSSWTSGEFELPTIARPAPDRVAVAVGSVQGESMRLVRGNAGLQYLFGGRGDEVENPDFVRAGLGPFNDAPRRSRSRSWRIPLQPGAIQDYYLDEREVSVAQYLDFLRQPSGYRNEAHWPAGSAPDAARRARLTTELESRSGGLPVTGVSWAEASAYAHWLDKRLPTWVEWEYAVRGGAEYRPYSGYELESADSSPIPASARVVAGAPAERGQGDWTPDRRFADLCGNVAEWTSTGLPDLAEGVTYPHQWAMENPERLLSPESTANRRWIVGGHYGQSRLDFTVADHRVTTYCDPRVGFRCASSLEQVQDRLGVVSSAGPTFTEQQ